jgi:hypothetical protein
MSQPIPTLFNHFGRIDFRYGYTGNVFSNSFLFRGPSIPAPGWTFAGWWSAALFQFGILLQDLCPSDYDHVSFWFFYNDSVTTHSFGTANLGPPIVSFKCLDPALCYCYFRRSGILGRNGQGWIFLPSVEAFLIEGDRYTPTGASGNEFMRGTLESPFLYNTQLYQPYLYSPSLGAASLVYAVKSFGGPRYRYRRRPGRDIVRNPYTYPVVP